MRWHGRIAAVAIGLMLTAFGVVIIGASREIIRQRILDVDLTPYSTEGGFHEAADPQLQWRLRGGEAVVAGIGRMSLGLWVGAWGVAAMLAGGMGRRWGRRMDLHKASFVVISAAFVMWVLGSWPPWWIGSDRATTALYGGVACCATVALVLIRFRRARLVPRGIAVVVVAGPGSLLAHGYRVTIAEPERTITIDGFWLRCFRSKHQVFAFKELEGLKWIPGGDTGPSMSVSFRQGEALVTYSFPFVRRKLFMAMEAVQAMNGEGYTVQTS